MAWPAHGDADPAQLPTRPGGLWSPPARPTEPRASGFGTTVFDVAVQATPVRPAASSGSVFDVCHAGVVLRALLFVHAAVGVGVAFEARSFAGWLSLAAIGSSIALPAVLLWLLIACGLNRPLGAMSLGAQWGAAIGLGAFSGGLTARVVYSMMSDTPVAGPSVWVASALAGAAFAAALFQWLHLRAKATLPAETAARLAELQSRIRPHFLFNTLNTALALVRLDPPRAEGVLEDLAELFRVAITDSGEAVTLGEEVELARRYLAIEQIRFGERLHVSWEIDPEADRARVPPLLLQPLVENAVRHGVEPSDAGGTIRVRTQVKFGSAVVTITNTAAKAQSKPGNGMALRNVRERLHLMHDVAAQFEVQRVAEGFRVQLVVPL
jgi:two-component system sensor histidine kinase AlgZ